MNIPSNPRGIGDNAAPDYARLEVDRLTQDYSELPTTVSELLDEARKLPEEIPDDEVKGKYTHLIKRFRDLKGRLEALHTAEKEPHLRRGQGVDQFFFGLIDKCMRRAKTNRPGAADILSTRLTDYDTRKLREEQERRRREAEEAARIAREAQEKAAKEAREAEEARLAAERARKPETVAEKAAVAEQKEVAASSAKVEAEVATGRAEEAKHATLARPADLMRHRDEATGTLSTVGTEPYAEIVDEALLDKAVLWNFIPIAAKAQALRGWAKTTGYSVQMPGAAIGKRPKSVVR